MDDLAGRFEWFADWARGTSPLYERLATGVADDPAMLALADAAPPDRSRPHLLFAAVHDLLLAGADGDLAAFYPTVTDDPVDPADEDPYPAFRAFVDAREDAVCERLRTRRTQTNSVRRCAALFPGFAHVSRRVGGEPFALVEVGPSAGLNMLWDRYAYDYGDHGRFGDPESPVTIPSTVRGDPAPPFPEEMPPVASRVGVDLHRLDVTDAADARWLRALVWPEHDRRHRLLRDAIEVARDHPPEIREGDALDLLPGVVAEVPDDRPVCLVTTQVLYQFSDEGRERFVDLVREIGADRELHWLASAGTSDDHDQGVFLTHFTVEGGDLAEGRLLVYDQHGAWVEWLGGA